jgi:hypothetical protein
MKFRALPLLLATFLAASPALAQKAKGKHSFAVIGHVAGDEALLERALSDLVETTPAFIVTNGIKGANEPCSDKLYARRRELLEEQPRPVVVSLAASDWSECRNSAGRTAAIERLNRVRELFFAEDKTLGKRTLDVTRLSLTAKFRSYAENAMWEVGPVMYATVNVPINNNHYLREAGRNSEFEDRLVANRAWLQRLFVLARRNKKEGLVIFSEGDLSKPAVGDGFDAPRKQIAAAAEKFGGKVLLVDSAGGTTGELHWQGKVGRIGVGSKPIEIRVTPRTPTLFSLPE